MEGIGLQTTHNHDKPLLCARVYSGRFLCAGKMAYDERGDVINISPENLMKIANTHVGVPVIINHKDVTEGNIEKEKVGYVSKVFYNDKGFEAQGKKHPADNWAWCDFIIEKQHAVDLLDKQGWELSNSYLPVEYPNYTAKDYDVDVIGGKGLHLAIVPEGRYDTKVVRLNANKEKTNINLSNKTMSILDNAKQRLLGKRSNSEYKHNEGKSLSEKHEGKHENADGTKEFEDNILPLDYDYMIEGHHPISGRHLLEYFKNVKNEEKRMQAMENYEGKKFRDEETGEEYDVKDVMHLVKSHMDNEHAKHHMENTEEEGKEEEEDETHLTLEEKIEKEKHNSKHKMHNTPPKKETHYNSAPKNNGFAKVFEAKKAFTRSNSIEMPKSISVIVDSKEANREIFGRNKNN